MSEITKRAFAASLKKLLSEKPLNKITITDISEDCGVNRQTFYYHFQDIYDLLDWVFTTETTKALNGKKSYDTWEEGFLQIFKYVLNNKAFVMNTYNSISKEILERYLYNETYTLLIGVIEELSKEMSVRDEDKKFIANFYKYGFVGLMLDWIRNGMKEDSENIVNKLSKLLYGDFSKALTNFRINTNSYLKKQN